MKELVSFLTLTVLGYLIGILIGFNPLEVPGFNLFASASLALGLYTAVTAIDIESLGKYKKTALTVITAGVPLQIIVTGLIMYIIYPHPISFLLAVAIDQIDPISVSTLLNNKIGMSKSAKSLLNVWASFDDPMTVLFGFTILLPIVTGVSFTSLSQLLLGLVLNIIPTVFIYLGYKNGLIENKANQIIILLVALIFTVATQSFLFVALLGLFIRPFKGNLLEKTTTALYFFILFIVGISLASYGLDLRLGFLLALVEFFIVQPLSAIFLVKGTTNDIFRLAFAQQNGLTTILMGITFQVLGFNVLPILLPAIVFIN